MNAYHLDPHRQMTLAVADCIVQQRSVSWIACPSLIGNARASWLWALDEARDFGRLVCELATRRVLPTIGA